MTVQFALLAGAPAASDVPVESILVFIGLLGIGFVVSRFALFKPRLIIGGVPFFLSGVEYIFLGMLIGPIGFNLLRATILNSLQPIIVLELGWIGIIYGLQFQREILSKTPLGHVLVMLIVSVVTFGIVAGGTFLFLQWLFPQTFQADLTAALMLGSVAVVSSPSSLAILSQFKSIKRTGVTTSLYQRMSSLDGLFGIIPFGFIFAAFHVYGSGESQILNPWEWGLLSILLGVIMGFLLYLFIRKTRHREDMVVLLLGFIIFSSGLAAFLHLSPLVINFVSGIILTNRRLPTRKILFDMFLNAEKVLYVILLIVAGAMCQFHFGFWIGALTAMFVLTRIIGKFWGFALARHALNLKVLRPTAGLGLLTQGGLSIAMAVSYAMVYENNVTAVVLPTVLLAVIVFQLTSPWLLWSELRKAGDAR